MSGPNPVDYAWWLASRASGVVALALISASVLVGLLMASRLMRRRGPALRRIHQSTALTGLAAIGVHGVTLLGDAWLHPGIIGIAVPFALPYRTLLTGLGVLAGYLAAIFALSFYVRRRIGARRWRRMHRLTLLAYVLALVHAVGAGTDTSIPAVRTAVLVSAIPALVLLAVRLVAPPIVRRAPQGAR